MFVGATPSDQPPQAPAGYEWARNPTRPTHWQLVTNTHSVHWQLAAQSRALLWLKTATPKG